MGPIPVLPVEQAGRTAQAAAPPAPMGPVDLPAGLPATVRGRLPGSAAVFLSSTVLPEIPVAPRMARVEAKAGTPAAESITPYHLP